MTETRTLIAVLDDEPQFCKAIARLLKTHGFDVATFTHGEEFFAACAARLPNCLLLDLHMPEPNGFDVLKRIALQGVPVLVITGHDQPGNAERVRDLGGVGYFLKPLKESQLLEAIHATIEHGSKTEPIEKKEDPRSAPESK